MKPPSDAPLDLAAPQDKTLMAAPLAPASNITASAKVIKNLVNYAAADPNVTPAFVSWPMAKVNSSIITLALRELQSSQNSGPGRKPSSSASSSSGHF